MCSRQMLITVLTTFVLVESRAITKLTEIIECSPINPCTDTPWDRMTIETIQSAFEEQDQPDLICEFRELLAEVTVAVESQHPGMIPLWTLVRDENLNLKYDRREICNRLNLDPTTGGPDYQRYNRMRNKLKRVVESCRSTDPNGGAP